MIHLKRSVFSLIVAASVIGLCAQKSTTTEKSIIDDKQMLAMVNRRRDLAVSQNVAHVTVFALNGNDASSSSGAFWSGHAFITVENLTSSIITVGKMSVPSYGGVSVGTWGNKEGHKGAWYNLECYFNHSQGAYGGRVSLSETINSNGLGDLSTYINDHDDWALLNNCSTFACGAWNATSSLTLSAGWINTPKELKNSIKKHDYGTDHSIPNDSRIGYYNGDTFVGVSMGTKLLARAASGSWNDMQNPESFPGLLPITF